MVFGILSAILLSLSGWLATNYKSSDDISIIITTILIVCFALSIAVVNKQAYKKIDELEEL